MLLFAVPLLTDNYLQAVRAPRQSHGVVFFNRRYKSLTTYGTRIWRNLPITRRTLSAAWTPKISDLILANHQTFESGLWSVCSPLLRSRDPLPVLWEWIELGVLDFIFSNYFRVPLVGLTTENAR